MIAKPLTSKPLTVGYLALTDAAPFLVARHLGLFEKHGVEVQLRQEVGWATIREKIIYGELDAAHAPAPMLWSTTLGIDSVACPVLTALVLNLHGNALTLSNRLWDAGVRDPASLREESRVRTGERKLTFGVVFMFSSHHLLLRSWLKSCGINPDKDVRIVVVPPAQMFRNLCAGTIDGYCAGEPYNSLAVQENAGWCPTWSAEAQPDSVEKVLLVTERFAFQRPREHAALVGALAEACAWCDNRLHRAELVDVLSSDTGIRQPASTILPALSGRFDCGHGRIVDIHDFIVFNRSGANVPTRARAHAIQRCLTDAHLLPAGSHRDLPLKLFREDLFRNSLALHQHETVSY